MALENQEIPMTADRFRAILGGIRKEIQRQASPGMSVVDELLTDRREEAGHD